MREKGRLLGALDHLSFDWAERIHNQGGEAAEAWMWQVGREQGGRSASTTGGGGGRGVDVADVGGAEPGKLAWVRGAYTSPPIV